MTHSLKQMGDLAQRVRDTSEEGALRGGLSRQLPCKCFCKFHKSDWIYAKRISRLNKICTATHESFRKIVARAPFPPRGFQQWEVGSCSKPSRFAFVRALLYVRDEGSPTNRREFRRCRTVLWSWNDSGD